MTVPPPPAPPRPHRRAKIAVAVVALLLSVLGAGGSVVRIPYDSIAPGSARRVDDLIKISGHPVYPSEGDVLFTTVSVREGVNLWEAVGGWLDRDVDVVHQEDIRGPIPADQYHQLNAAAMADSKTSAEAVVLRHLGFPDLGGGAEVGTVDPELPAAQVLRPKDVLVAIDGRPISGPADAVPAIRAHRPGDEIRLGVVRDGGAPVELTTTLGRNEEGQALLGVTLSQKLKLPFEITIDSGTIEGPSAGLAYSLALIDELTPGELTGGTKVAVTGEIEPDGKVGAVGGVGQKVAAVRQTGDVVLFLVPKDNLGEAQAHAGDHLLVRAVDSFDEALKALAELPGSNATSLASSGAGQR
ncbi:MAG TPA: S16 family serine protease [Acidimicrobiales bacterium]|jgi:PDZ domain-containing protein|nr:S16 family serine protease [Acidimicrobiales bacterium]